MGVIWCVGLAVHTGLTPHAALSHVLDLTACQLESAHWIWMGADLTSYTSAI